MVKNSIKVFARLKNEDGRNTKVVKYQIYRRAEHEDISFPVNGTTDVSQKNRKYRFCKVFDETSTQADIFSTVAKPIINSVVNGFNGTIFAYGQTGSGKTYSITGSPNEYNERGIIPRSIEQIFELIKMTPNLYNVYVSYLEIYNEIGYDLLNSKCQPSRLEELPRVVLLEDANGEGHLRNLSVLHVTNEREAMRLLFLGDTNRTIAETPMNEYSSRSHCIFTIYINSRNESGGKLRRSKLHLVDLAGSERICKSKISGVTLREAKNINLSLHYLEQVILALSQSNRPHIPYRNSMMTYILRDSLSGNSLTSMLATMAITQDNHPETLTTCKFAQRVACISTEAIINEEVDPQEEIQLLRAEIDQLRKQLAKAKGENIQKALSFEDKEKCKKITDDFLLNNKEGNLENLTSSELVCCMKYLKSNIEDLLSNKIEKQKLIDDERIDLTNKFSEILKEKDDEISTLTKLLEIDSQNNKNHEETLQPIDSTLNLDLKDLHALKLQLPFSQRDQFDIFLMDKNNIEGITQIKKSLEQKCDLSKNISKMIQKCQENIADIRQKLIKEQMGSEKSEKLHDFLISQQRIYKDSLEQLDSLKNETEYLRESLKQSEKKLIKKFQYEMKNKDKKNENFDRDCDYGFDFFDNIDITPEKDECVFHKSTSNSRKNNYKSELQFSTHEEFTNDFINRKKIKPKKLDLKTFLSEIEDVSQNFNESTASLLNIYSDSSNVSLINSNKVFRSQREIPCGEYESSYSDYKSSCSGYTTPKNEEEKHIDQPKDKGMDKLIKSTDTAEFIEFMKTIPLTGDYEVDDEIFNFYRSKFE